MLHSTLPRRGLHGTDPWVHPPGALSQVSYVCKPIRPFRGGWTKIAFFPLSRYEKFCSGHFSIAIRYILRYSLDVDTICRAMYRKGRNNEHTVFRNEQ
jgi:hypothetical protein